MLAAWILAAVTGAQTEQLPASEAPRASFSFAELSRRAAEQNSWILAKRARLRSLLHTGHQKQDESSWRGWDLGLDAEYYPGTGGSSQLAGYDTRVSLGLTVPLFGSQSERNLRLQEIQAEQSIAEGELGEASKIVLLGLLEHYVSYSRGVAMRDTLAQIQETLRTKRELLSSRVRAGESLPADFLETERDLAKVSLRVEQNREAMRFALEEMRADLGDPLLAEFDPQPLPWREIAQKIEQPVGVVAQAAIQGHPTIRGLEGKVRLLHEQEEETGSAYPRSAFTVGLVSQSGGAAGSESGPALSFSMSLPLGAARILRERQRAIASDRDRYLADLDRKRQEIGAEIQARFEALRIAKESSRLAQSQWDLAQERERIAALAAKELPDLGESSLVLRALDAQVERLESSLQKDAAELELAGSHHKILLSMGQELSVMSLPKSESALTLSSPLDLWVWSAEIVADLGERRRFFELAHDLGVTGVYLGLNARETERFWEEAPGSLRGFLAECHERGIRVECLLADNEWAQPGGNAGLRELLGRLTRFHQGATRATRYDALHLDVEPHALPEWGQESQATLVRGYLDLLGECRASGLPVIADLPSWYERIPAENGNLLLAVLRRVDGIVVMDYRTDAKRFEEEAQDELRAASEQGKSIRIAVSVEPLLPDSQAFRDWKTLAARLEESANQFRAFDGFAGFAVQSLADLQKILSAEGLR